MIDRGEHRFRTVVALLCTFWGPVAAGATEAVGTEAEIEEIVEVIKKAYYEAQDALEELPRDHFEPLPVLKEANYEAEAIASWVEQNTRWVPYEGVLRGADGVLLDRQGNSLDRSLFLVELLESAGYDARLARGRLSPTVVEQVLERAEASRPQPESVEALIWEDADSVAARARADAAALAALVDLPDTRRSQRLLDAVADHWWVEARLESGWQPIDPLLTGPLEGLRGAPAERLTPSTLPDSLFHEVTLRVVIERWDRGETFEEVPLEHTLRAASRIYHDLELQFAPFGYDVVPARADALAEGIAVADTTRDWLPMIRQGEERVRRQGFGIDGQLERNPAKPATQRKLEDATRSLRGLQGESVRQESVLTACWIEYEITGPGRRPQIVRRELFDLIGPARRRLGKVEELSIDAAAVRQRGQALMGTHRLLITGTDLPPIVHEKASLELWARQGPQLAALMRLILDPNAQEPLQRLHREPLVAVDLLGLATLRRVLSPHRSETYLASPNILTTHYLVEVDETLTVRRAIDLAANEVGVRTGGSLSPARIRLDQGVLDTVLEAALSDQGEILANTAELFALRRGATGEWRVTDTPATELPEAARARMADAVAAGRIVVSPERLDGGHQAAWWEIDPETGTTLGIGSRGWGQGGVEDVSTRTIGTAGTTEGTRRVGVNVACAVVIAHLRMNGLIYRTASGSSVVTMKAIEMLVERGCDVWAAHVWP